MKFSQRFASSNASLMKFELGNVKIMANNVNMFFSNFVNFNAPSMLFALDLLKNLQENVVSIELDLIKNLQENVIHLMDPELKDMQMNYFLRARRHLANQQLPSLFLRRHQASQLRDS